MTHPVEFSPSAENARTLARAVLAWWAEARYETSGDRGERNVFDITPDFVLMAQKMMGENSSLTYLEACQAQVVELSTLLADYEAIAENDAVAPQQRFQLLMAPACKGRILSLLESLGTPASLGCYDPGILGYETCINLTKTAFDEQMQSLRHLCPDMLLD
jgi:hypothetical protein